MVADEWGCKVGEIDIQIYYHACVLPQGWVEFLAVRHVHAFLFLCHTEVFMQHMQMQS